MCLQAKEKQQYEWAAGGQPQLGRRAMPDPRERVPHVQVPVCPLRQGKS